MSDKTQVPTHSSGANPQIITPQQSPAAPVFWVRYLIRNTILALGLIFRGQWHRVFRSIHARAYNKFYFALFVLKRPFLARRRAHRTDSQINVITDHRVAITSPDHLAPHGTKYDNSTNRKFVLLMDQLLRKQTNQPCFLDLGCSGGQLVKDFSDIGWTAVGLEGSDYSLKHKRANWRTLAGKHLFTCDITKPFRLECNGQEQKFNLITAWEVMEHIHINDLDQLFRNIRNTLVEGGFFIASTAGGPSDPDGIELHQTQMTNAEWKQFLSSRYPDLQSVELGLKIYQYVRFDFGDPSFLVYQKSGNLAR